MFRKHQREFKEIITGIKKGSGVKVIDIMATPGAGKSSIPIQACELITSGFADALLWVVPRAALQNQGERGFFDPFFREMLGHNSLIRASTNERNPCRGTNGFVTTYQAIGVDKDKTVLNEIRSKRYIIILDEFHHLEKDGVWHEAINDIVMAGHFLIKMTGTLGRGDKKEIAFINYKKKLPYFNNVDTERMILYSRIDALKEKAILPIEFHLNDAELKWERPNGNTSGVKSFKNARTPVQMSEALFTAINSDFAAEMLKACVLHWSGIKKKNIGAKLLIVTADYELAKNAVFMLKRSIGIEAEIATSHESKSAIKSINRFKSGDCNCLVTIAMAYEGLDVPGITHIGVLTNIRSREWIEQMLARGVRIDKTAGPYETQKCYVFAPMDRRFKKVVDLIKKQQLSAVEYFSKIKEEKEPDEELGDEIDEDLDLFGEPLDPRQKVIPISSKMTDRDRFLMGIDDIPYENNTDTYIQPLRTIKEQEIELRQKIHKYVNKYCFENRYKHQQINHELKINKGKSRDLMTLDELKNLMEYLVKYYPIEIIDKIKDLPGISQPRGRKGRVTTKVEKWTGRSEILKASCYDPIRHLLKK